MKKILISLVALFAATTMFASVGALDGKFTIDADGNKVVFSRGNLQYQRSTETFRFAEYQYEYVGSDTQGNVYVGTKKCSNENANYATYTGWADLFCWGTGDRPAYYSENNADFATFHEWGENKISNGGDEANLWRTLTEDEWNYLTDERENADSLKGLAVVEGVNCALLFPDDFEEIASVPFIHKTEDCATNTLTEEQWYALEDAGVVCLPLGGWMRMEIGTLGTDEVQYMGVYWSSTKSDNSAPIMGAYADDSDFGINGTFNLSDACAVRLVQEAEIEPTTWTVTFSAAETPSLAPAPDGLRRAPMVFGGGHVTCQAIMPLGDPITVNNGDEVEEGTVLRFTAKADALGWALDYWSNGVRNNVQELTVTSDINLIAYFKEAAMYQLTLQDDGNGVVTIFNGQPGEESYTATAIPVMEGQQIILTAHPNIGYEFDHWDNYVDPYFDEELDDWVIPEMTGNLTVKAHFRRKAAETLVEGAIGGLFTIGEDAEHNPIRVQFSKGNLQYIAGDGKTHKVADETIAETSLARRGTWQFAEEQNEYIGSKNNNAAEDYDEPIDIFCYGASGYDNRYPWLKTISALEQNINETNYDFGVFNAISNGGNEPGLWRMLTKDEVDYMLYQRGNHANYVYWGRQLHGIGTANGEAGLFLMPDGWVMPGELAKEDITFLPLEVEDYTTNKFKSTAWTVLEQSGVVFIPAGGARYDMGGGVTIYAVGQAVYCQLSTYQDEGMAYALGAMPEIPGEFAGGCNVGPFPTGTGGCSVRLVRDMKDAPSAIEQIKEQSYTGSQKIIKNGQLLILRNGHTYTITGAEVR